MKIMRTALLPFLISIFTFSSLFLAPADAGASAAARNGSGTLSIGTGTIIVYATDTNTGSNLGTPLVLSNSSAAQYFYLRNTGTIATIAITMTFSYTTSPAKTSFLYCGPQISFSSLHTCASGSSTSMSSLGTVTIPISMAPNTWNEFELDPGKTTTPTLSMSVSSTQIRPKIITNA